MSSNPQKPTAGQYEQASHWVSVLHDGTPTLGQERVFQAWLASSPAHKLAYDEVEAFWHQLGGLEAVGKPQLEAARLYAEEAQDKRYWLPRYSLALAASVLVMVIALPFVQFCLDNGNYRTAIGEQQHIQLSDGTRIDLNTDTEVQVTYTFFDRELS